jgi:phosphorylated CTD-interacting factor 1
MSSSDGSGSDADDDGLAMLVGSSFARGAETRLRPSSLEEEDAAATGSSGKRPLAYSLHDVTSQPVKGLGARLAGTATHPAEDLWLPSSRPWSAADAAANAQAMRVPLRAHDAARLEMRRAVRLARLRALFCELCADQKMQTVQRKGEGQPLVINALERWRFLCKWQEDAGARSLPDGGDALLPTGPPLPADAGLTADLCRAGLAPMAAAEMVAAVRAASVEAADDVVTLHKEISAARPAAHPTISIRSESQQAGLRRLWAVPSREGVSAGTMDADEMALSVRVTEATVSKLRALFARRASNRPVADAEAAAAARGGGDSSGGGSSRSESTHNADAEFDARVFALLLRYESIGGAGFQAALGGGVLRELQTALGVNFECFASPLNAYYGAFCSAFPDVDAPFGSLGSFATFAPLRGAYEVNPPFVDGIIDASSAQLLRSLDTAQASNEPLCFVVVLPGWADSEGYCALLAAPLLRRSMLIAKADHGYVDGAQHARQRAYRYSTYDTRLFILQTDAHHAAHALDDGVMVRLERALAECTPTIDGPVRLKPPASGSKTDGAEGELLTAGVPPGDDDGVTARDAPACLRAKPGEGRKRKRRRKK